MIYIIPTDTCFGIGCAIDDTKSYNKIYQIKKRATNKPLAIMVESFEYLEKITDLNKNQINFLKNYQKPFTILTNSNYIKMLINLEQEDFCFENKEFYDKIAFRVANNEIEKKLIKEIGPIFLTSANFSGEKEIYDINQAKTQFNKFLKEISFLGENIILDENIKPSDIFEFVGDSLEIKFNRKN